MSATNEKTPSVGAWLATTLVVILWAAPLSAATEPGPAAAADSIVRPLAGSNDVVLRGARLDRTFTVEVDPVDWRAGDVTLVLDWRTSSQVDLARSQITVEAGGLPVRTLRLAELPDPEAAPWRLALPELAAGYQPIRLVLDLRQVGDSCEDAVDALPWFRVRADSRLAWSRKDETPAPSFDALPGRWRTLGDAGVGIDLAAPRSPAALAAWLDANHMLRDWGVPLGDGETRLVLSVASDAPEAGPEAGAAATLAAYPGAAALLQLSGDTLTILATDGAGLGAAVAALARPGFRTLCPPGTCVVPRGAVEPAPARAARVAEDTSSLRALGFPGGWTATGSGVHRLQFTYVHPVLSRVNPQPHLVLHVGSTDGSLLGPSSHLTVRLEGAPLATYRLPLSAAAGPLAVPITRDYWGAPAWSFEVTVSLVGIDDTPCALEGQEQLWVRLDPGSAVQVIHRREEREGLAEFYRSTRRLPPTIHGPLALAPAQLHALAAALYPMHQQHPTRSWRWLDPALEPCHVHCVDVVEQETTRGFAALAAGGDARVWRQRAGAASVPMLDAAQAFFMQADGGASGDQHRALIALPRPDTDATFIDAVPRYPVLESRVAFWHDGAWVSLEDGERTLRFVTSMQTSGDATPDTAAAPLSEEREDLRRINLAWGLAVVVAMGGLLAWIVRAGRGSTDLALR